MTNHTENPEPNHRPAPPAWDGNQGYEGPVESAATQLAIPGLLTLDVSWSMAQALSEAQAAVDELIWAMRREPLVAEQARIGLVTFADTAAVDLEFCAIADPRVKVPDLVARGTGTDYCSAFETAGELLERGVPALATTVDGTKQVVLRPTLYLVTDGQPNGRDWVDALARIRSGRIRPNVVAFGFGDADRATITRIADEGRAYFAEDGQHPAAVFQQILKIILATMVTVTRAVAGGQQVAPTVDPKSDPATSGLMLLDALDLTTA